MPIKIAQNTITIPRSSICEANQKTSGTLGNSAKSVKNSSTPLPTKSILKSTNSHQNSATKKRVSFNLPAQESTIKSASICEANQKTSGTLGNSAKSVNNSSTPLPTKSILKSTNSHQNSATKKRVSFNLPAQESTIKSASICEANQKTSGTLGNSAKSVNNSSTPLPTKSILKSTNSHQNSATKKRVSFNLPAQETTTKSANTEVKTNESAATADPRKVTMKDLNVLSSEISKIKNSIRELMVGKDSWQSAQKLNDVSLNLLNIKNKIQDFNPRIKSNLTKGQSTKLKKLEAFEKRIEKRQNELAPMKKKNDYQKNRSDDYAKSRETQVKLNEKAKMAKQTENL